MGSKIIPLLIGLIKAQTYHIAEVLPSTCQNGFNGATLKCDNCMANPAEIDENGVCQVQVRTATETGQTEQIQRAGIGRNSAFISLGFLHGFLELSKVSHTNR